MALILACIDSQSPLGEYEVACILSRTSHSLGEYEVARTLFSWFMKPVLSDGIFSSVLYHADRFSLSSEIQFSGWMVEVKLNRDPPESTFLSHTVLFQDVDDSLNNWISIMTPRRSAVRPAMSAVFHGHPRRARVSLPDTRCFLDLRSGAWTGHPCRPSRPRLLFARFSFPCIFRSATCLHVSLLSARGVSVFQNC